MNSSTCFDHATAAAAAECLPKLSNPSSILTSQSPFDLLRPLSPKISETRDEHYLSLQSLPAELADIALAHYQRRIDRASGRPLLGEYAPWLLADALGVTDEHHIKSVANCWMHIYHGVLIIDDLLDEDCELATFLIVAHLLEQRGLTRLLLSVPKPSSLAATIETSFTETAQAAVDELGSLDRSGVVTRQEIETRAGRKLSLLSICTAALSQFSPRKLSTLQIDAAVRHFATAIQLLDDVTDFREDIQQHRETLPTQTFQSTNVHILCDDQLLFALFKNGAFTQTLAAIASHLNKASQLLRGNGHWHDGVAIEFIDRLHDAVCLTRESLASVSKPNECYSHGFNGDKQQDVQFLCRQIRAHLEVIAQSS